MALRIFKRLRDLLDVDTSGATAGDALVLDVDGETWVPGAGGGGGAPTDVNYLVGTASGDLSAEIIVGTSPGGELGGTWASPTVDATHSGSSHASVQSAAEATAASALSAHEADTTNIHGITNTAALALTANVQPLDSDLTAIAALSTTSFGRALLILADQAALLSAAGAAAASHAHAGEDITSGTVADARIASTIARDSEVTSAISALSSVYQPLDSDLTAVAALTTTSFGRAFLAFADEAAFKAGVNLEAGTDFPAQATFDDHSARHESGGADAIKLDDLAAPDDNTDLNASTTKHGLLLKLDNSAVHYLNGQGAWATPSAAVNVTYETRSSNTILAGADNAKSIDITAAITQTFTAAATLGAGWWVILRNKTQDGTTLVTLDPNSAELIDGLATATMYSGETRLVMCTGSAFVTQLLEGGYAKFTPTGGTFIVPAGIAQATVVCIGSGGQGGGGPSAVSTLKSGGGGGGGGGVSVATLRPGDLGAAGASITVAVGAGGSAAGGPGGAGAGAAGTAGSDGAVTTFGTLLRAGGGGGGAGGTNASVSGGAGGSVINSAAGTTAGIPASSAANALAGQAAPSQAGGLGFNSEWGGAGGAGGKGTGSPTGLAAGNSIAGGPGGGSGGGVTAANAGVAGGAGGATQAYAALGGGGGAGGTGGASPTAGTAGAFTGPYCGAGGGGGGGASADVVAKNGAVGSVGGGGGGGGGACSATSSPAGGTGGAGGPGECRVWYS